jgi:hypothetical protein
MRWPDDANQREVSEMRKLVLIAATAVTLSFATPVLAAEAGAVVGGTAGAWTGGAIGFMLGGPIGAVIGGTTGAIIGGGVGHSVLDDDVRFGSGGAVVVEGGLGVGDVVGDQVRLRRISGESQYGYFRANGRIYVVDRDTREVVEIRRG